jgi:hypothetical protein
MTARTPTMHSRTCAAVLLVACMFGISTPRAWAGSNLNTELAEVAKKLKELLDGRGEDSLAVGQFTGPSHIPTSSGPAISKTLADELQKIGIRVTQRANLEVKGDYLDVEDKQTKQLAALLKGRVLDRSGAVVTEFERGIFGDATLASMFGVTADLPANANGKERDQRLRDGIDSPRVKIQNTRVSSGPGSPFGIEILVKSSSGYVPRAPAEGTGDDKGLAFVPIHRDEIYAVRLINEAPFEAAVTLTIDGINVFAFSDVKNPSTGAPRYAQWVVPPRARAEIQGWHRTNELSESFLVTEYAKSAAGELRSTANIGTITAAFAAAWPKGAKPPADEPPQPPSEFSRSADATGRGPRVTTSYQEVERNFGVVRSSVSVRYSK